MYDFCLVLLSQIKKNTIFLKCVLLGYDAVKFSRQINNNLEERGSFIFTVEEERCR